MMSKDIRSFFRPQKVQKSQLEDDSDVIPESPDVQIQMKKREVRKKRVLSDSDEEIFSTKKKKSSEDTKKSSHKTLKHKSPGKKELKEVKALDVFGTAPINRSEPIMKKVKKKTETGIHSDDDFDKSLLELDTADQLELNRIKKEISPNKSNNDKQETKPSLEKNIKGDDKSTVIPHSKDLEITFKKDFNKDKKRHLDELSLDETGPTKHSKTSKSKETANKLNESTHGNTVSIKTKKHEFTESASMEPDKSELETKKNLETNFNESVVTDEERFERKRHSAALYQKYLNRSGPKHLGSKQIPEGAPNCLKDCAFLLTGVLDSFERDEVAEAITKFGGTVKNSISRKVTHVLAGDEAGPAKIAKAHEFGIKILNEDDFLQLIQNKSKKQKNEQLKIKEEKQSQKKPNQKINKDTNVTVNQTTNSINSKTSTKECLDDEAESVDRHVKIEKARHRDNKSKNWPKVTNEINTTVKSKSESAAKACTSANKDDNDLKSDSSKNLATNSQQCMMWVEKYKPQTLKQIIGQHGEASNVKKLCNWLTKWYANRKAKLPKPSPWSKTDDGGYYKAALLSGPPGVGKTTTVSLVCKELGFDMVEFNASDTRNKSLIREQIGELLTTTSLSGYAKGKTGKQAVSKKHVLVMDEVDGMAGNEDRGGLQELIGLIKSASVPIICMCNDRSSQKMRSLVNYCYELKFSRPRVDQIKAAMMSICCKEGLKVGGEALARLVAASNQDVRQTLNLLSVWAAHPDPAALHTHTQQPIKDVKLGPWEAIRKVFSAEEHKTMSIHDKSDLFFYDYSLAPLFVQENYLQVAPHCPKHEVLARLSSAAESISAGDLVDARIRGNQAWNLLPIQAMYSSVIPGHAMAGHVTGQIQFPGWLGKNSRRSKMHRLCQEIHAHTRLSTSGSKSSIFLDYCSHLRDAIVAPLVRDKCEGIEQSLRVLESYHLLREDLESLSELALWPGQRNPMILIDSKVKAAMTRTYNKKASALPYAPGPVRRARAAAGADADADADADALSNDDDQDSDLEHDALIKKKKVKEIEKSNSGREAAGGGRDRPAASKGKGKKK